MNDRRDHDDARLIAGAFHGDWANGPAAEFARAAAAHARRRRAVRRTLAGLGTATVLAAAFFVSRQLRPTMPATPAIATAKVAYEIISDDELIAQLHDRPLLVVKKDSGAKEIHLLEESPPLE